MDESLILGKAALTGCVGLEGGSDTVALLSLSLSLSLSHLPVFINRGSADPSGFRHRLETRERERERFAQLGFLHFKNVVFF